MSNVTQLNAHKGRPLRPIYHVLLGPEMYLQRCLFNQIRIVRLCESRGGCVKRSTQRLNVIKHKLLQR